MCCLGPSSWLWFGGWPAIAPGVFCRILDQANKGGGKTSFAKCAQHGHFKWNCSTVWRACLTWPRPAADSFWPRRSRSRPASCRCGGRQKTTWSSGRPNHGRWNCRGDKVLTAGPQASSAGRLCCRRPEKPDSVAPADAPPLLRRSEASSAAEPSTLSVWKESLPEPCIVTGQKHWGLGCTLWCPFRVLRVGLHAYQGFLFFLLQLLRATILPRSLAQAAVLQLLHSGLHPVEQNLQLRSPLGVVNCASRLLLSLLPLGGARTRRVLKFKELRHSR